MEWPFLMKRSGGVAWFGHVHRKVIYAPMRKSELIQMQGTKNDRGRPRITLVEIVKKYMSIKEVRQYDFGQNRMVDT